MNRNKKNWPEGRLAKLMEMHRSGSNIGDMAAALETSEQSIRTKLISEGEPSPPSYSSRKNAPLEGKDKEAADFAIKRWGEGAGAKVIVAELKRDLGYDKFTIAKVTALGCRDSFAQSSRLKAIDAMGKMDPAVKKDRAGLSQRLKNVKTFKDEAKPTHGKSRLNSMFFRNDNQPMSLDPVEPSFPERDGKDAPSGYECSLLDLNERKCKWPMFSAREPVGFFCGRPKEIGGPYCEEHHARAYAKTSLRAPRPIKDPGASRARKSDRDDETPDSFEMMSGQQR